MTHAWSPDDYRQHAGFVPALGTPLVDRLAARPGERILDLGCGDGTLTAQLAASGATVFAVDSSAEMVAAARSRGLDARLADATALPFDAEFDGVLSNAVLHWVLDPDRALEGVRRALKPGGRFVAELGGHTNIAAIGVAIRAVLAGRGIPMPWPWYFPSVRAYAARLATAGLVVDEIELFNRPTPLPTGMDGWLRTFGGAVLAEVPAAMRRGVIEDIVALLAPALRDESGGWTADYTRLRLVAHRES
jgi:trans-aconitate methyltransferase